MARDLGLDWEFVSWLKQQTRLKVVLKGIMHPEDATKAAKLGVDAIWLSNHGGRQLDTVLPPAAIIPEVRTALAKEGLKAELYVDGGVRRGSDIMKCLSLGADFVFIGRPLIWGLFGEKEGLSEVVDILESELTRTLQLCGVDDV